jgi:hypothetical protein
MNNSQRTEKYLNFMAGCIKMMIASELMIFPVLSGMIRDEYMGAWQTSLSFIGADPLSL